MARSIRIEHAGALYHVMARGNRREPIYRDDDDRRFFLKTLAEACERTGWRVQTPSLPDAGPNSGRPRCGGRKSNFLADSHAPEKGLHAA